MAKDKPKKPRPGKYAEKIVIKTTFEDTIKIFAKLANNKATTDNTEPPKEE